MRTKWIAAAVALACAGAAQADTAAKTADDPRIAAILDSLGKVRTIESVALSPDGKHLAWTVKTNGKPALEVADADGRNARRITKAKNCSEISAAWAPDSRHLAFLSDCAGKAPGVEEGKQNDINVVDITGADQWYSHLRDQRRIHRERQAQETIKREEERKASSRAVLVRKKSPNTVLKSS